MIPLQKRIILIAAMLLFCSGVLYGADSEPVAAEEITSVEERRIRVSIEAEYVKLDQQKSKIAAQEEQLKILETEVDRKLAAMQQLRDKKLEALQQLRDELVKLFDRKDEKEMERIAELSKIYEKMNPQKAAVLIKALDDQLAVEVLLGIKKKTAGKILDSLDPATAIELSKAFTEIPLQNNVDY
ncbi:MAG: hypothetical protein U9R69_09135 [Thermodesulfobacteriota bacterium]|nr:hypothetical protein [Thermodesulfobacteriota bacterium]